MINYSLTGAGITSCSGHCLYCSAAKTLSYKLGCKPDIDELVEIDKLTYSQWQKDWAKVEETVKNNEQYKNEMKLPEEQRSVHIDVWGADSGTNLLVLQEMKPAFEEIMNRLGVHKFQWSTSTNGLPLMRDDLCEYYQNSNIEMQISHDGLGQWLRTPGFDPMTIPNAYKMMRSGNLRAVNCCTNFYNYSLIDNMNYWTGHLMKAFPEVYDPKQMASKELSDAFRKMYVKINHIYHGTLPTKAINVDGRFRNQTYYKLKGSTIGDMNFRNDREMAEKYGIPEMAHVLDEYIHEYWLIYHICKKVPKDNVKFMPFRSYFEGQWSRWQLLKSHDQMHSACVSFQKYRHGIGDPKGWKDQTFVIDTLGRYSECNLIDGGSSTLNPGGVQADFCKGCKYEYAAECNGCGCEPFEKQCEYSYRWEQFLEEVALLEGNVKGFIGKYF